MEHLDHFGLSRDPFANDPQVEAYFPSPEHTGVERRLQRGVSQRKGLCVLTGPPGAGKTMVVRHLLDALEEEVFEACLLVPVPGISDGAWVMSRLAQQLGVEEPAEEPAALLGEIYEQMAIVREDGRHTVVILDETQMLLDQGALSVLQALLNLEYEERRLLTLILVGSPELEQALARETGLGERVDIHVRLPGLDAATATQYLTHRIRRVGGSPAILEPAALSSLIAHAAGAPRRLNTLADNALYEAFLAGRVSANADDVARAAADLALPGSALADQAPPAPSMQQPVAAGSSDAETSARIAPPSASAPESSSLESVFDDPAPEGPRGADVTTLMPAPGDEPLDLDDVVAAPTDPVFRRAVAEATQFVPDAEAPMAAPRGAADATMILSAPDDAGAETLLAPEPVAPRRGPPKEEEIEDLFADLVEE